MTDDKRTDRQTTLRRNAYE